MIARFLMFTHYKKRLALQPGSEFERLQLKGTVARHSEERLKRRKAQVSFVLIKANNYSVPRRNLYLREISVTEIIFLNTSVRSKATGFTGNRQTPYLQTH